MRFVTVIHPESWHGMESKYRKYKNTVEKKNHPGMSHQHTTIFTPLVPRRRRRSLAICSPGWSWGVTTTDRRARGRSTVTRLRGGNPIRRLRRRTAVPGLRRWPAVSRVRRRRSVTVRRGSVAWLRRPAGVRRLAVYWTWSGTGARAWAGTGTVWACRGIAGSCRGGTVVSWGTATTVAGWWSAERGTSPKPQASDKLPA